MLRVIQSNKSSYSKLGQQVKVNCDSGKVKWETPEVREISNQEHVPRERDRERRGEYLCSRKGNLAKVFHNSLQLLVELNLTIVWVYITNRKAQQHETVFMI